MQKESQGSDPKSNSSKKTPSFNKFSQGDFEKWKELPRKKMIEEIITRHGVKNNRAGKNKKEEIKWPGPTLVRARGKVGSKASYHFYLKRKGKRPYPLHFPVDVPFSPNAEWVDIPNWKKSKRYLEISSAISELSYAFLAELLNKKGTSPILAWFSNSLLLAGFMDRDFVSQLADDIGMNRLSDHCKKFFSLSEEDARILLKGWTIKELYSLTDEQRKMIEDGQMAKVFRVPAEFLAILQSNTEEKQTVLENQNVEKK